MKQSPASAKLERWLKLLRHPHFAKPMLPPRTWLVKTSRVVVRLGLSAEEERLRERWKGTTPQGREIIRKKLYALKKLLNQAQPGSGSGTNPNEPKNGA